MTKIEVSNYQDICFVELVGKKDFKILEKAYVILAELKECLEANNEDNKRLYLTAGTQKAVEPILVYIEELNKLCRNFNVEG